MWRSAALTGPTFQQRWKNKKELSCSPFNRLHHWIIAEFFLGFSLVRTSLATTSAKQRAGRETDRQIQRECHRLMRHKVVLKSLNLNFRGKHNTGQWEKERETGWGVCHSNLVPQGSATQHYLKAGQRALTAALQEGCSLEGILIELLMNMKGSC